MITKSQLREIKVLSFDGDMTLWDFQKAMFRALGFAITALKQRYPGPVSDDLTIEKMIQIRNTTAMELKGKVTKLEEIRYRAFQRTLQYVGVEDDTYAAYLNTLYLKHRFEDIELYPDALSTLRTLGKVYTLGLLSNGNSYPERCGLDNTFAFTVYAENVGVEKPDKRMFQEACRQAGCSAGAMMHIGDSLNADVVGAQHSGMIAVWLNRNYALPDEGISPDVEIHSLSELVSLLN